MRLNMQGRCCGRKPIQYRRPDPHSFCDRCDREFDSNGEQRENWAWRKLADGSFESKKARALITSPSDPATLSGETCYYCGNVMDEEEGSACSACIARVEADLKRPASTTPVLLPADLDLSAMPAVDPSSALFLKCPKCRDGFAGTDHTGEACDCHYCDGDGRITAQAFVEQRDRMEEIIGDNMTYEIRAEEANATSSALAEALEKIERWFGEFPETGRFWDEPENKQPISYAACYGSNGERDYMRGIARAALAIHRKATT